MVESVLRHCKRLRYDDEFVKSINDGDYTIEGGTIQLPFAVNGQYVHIIGSKLNDGVYEYPVSGLRDESFTGTIRVLSLPMAFVKLCEDMSAWQAANSEALNSPYQSESFGGYSYSKASGTSGAVTVYDAFKARLTEWRKI